MMGGPATAKLLASNGVGEIRTHEGLAPLAVFKTAAFNHSATTPEGSNLLPGRRLRKSAEVLAHGQRASTRGNRFNLSTF
jgi:hypothetical protein